MNDEVDYLDIIFRLVSRQEHPVNWDIVPQMACWVVAWALRCGEASIVVLSTNELASLVYVGRGVRAHSSEWHEETWDIQGEIEQVNSMHNKSFVELDPQEI